MEITQKKNKTKQQLTTKIISKKNKKQKFVTRFELI